MKLEVNKISSGYNNVLILDKLNLTVQSGEILTLIGPNGCGKSTLLKTVGRLLKPSHGTVILDGKNIHRMNTVKLAQIMGMLPQSHYCADDLTVEELTGYGRFPHRRRFQPFTAEDRSTIENALVLTRLQHLRKRNINTLSGGERQRAWIAMILAQSPKLLLLDEPTTFLDIRCQLEVMELIAKLNRELGLTVLMVLHDLNLATRFSTRMATVGNGKITNIGTPAEILNREILRATFNIETRILREPNGTSYVLPYAVSDLDS